MANSQHSSSTTGLFSQEIRTVEDASELCRNARIAMRELLDIIQQETDHLQAGDVWKAAELQEEKTRRAESYFHFSRAVQANIYKLETIAPQALEEIKSQHDSMATDLAENLRIVAVARALTEDLISDVSKQLGQGRRPTTYSRTGAMAHKQLSNVEGLSVNKSL